MIDVCRRIALAVCLLCSAPPAPAGAEQSPPPPSSASPAAAVTFNKEVAPVIFRHCASCHRPGSVAPFSLLTYDEVRQRSQLITDVTERHFMPPWKPESAHGEFEGDRRLTDHQIEIFQRWAEGGFQEGAKQDLPPPPSFSADWQLGTPDLVVAMPEAFTAPADGGDVFRNFVLPVALKRRRYVKALEFRPENPKVLHHARILLDDTGDLRRRDAADQEPGFSGMEAPGARFPDGHFLGWSPGKSPSRTSLPWVLDPGVDFVVQMHLKPSGRPEAVRASIGLYFSDDPPAASPVIIQLGSKSFDIPPGARDHAVTDSFVLPVDITMLRIYPHAHYLAREMMAMAQLPDGSERRLLKIADWDFNWQDEYEYARPLALPRGTVITMRYTYDNSADNPRNPNAPPSRVRFGAQTTDEMAELLVQVLPNTTSELPVLRRAVAGHVLLADTAGAEKRLADAPGDYDNRNALGVAYMKLGRTADAVRQFEAALQAAPEHAIAHYNLGTIAYAAAEIDAARAHFERALKTQPDYSEAHTNLGVLLGRSGRMKDAVGHFRKALAARPGNPQAQNNLARALLQLGKVREAIGHLEDVLSTLERSTEVPASQLTEFYGVLSDAYAADGDVERAIRAAQNAMKKAIASGDTRAVQSARDRLDAYQERLTSAESGVLP
jgi:tetratricopeptide (TPR) repeat protein